MDEPHGRTTSPIGRLSIHCVKQRALMMLLPVASGQVTRMSGKPSATNGSSWPVPVVGHRDSTGSCRCKANNQREPLNTFPRSRAQQHPNIHRVKPRMPAKRHRQIQFLVDHLQRPRHTFFAHRA
jgi:hypothetical protein